MAVANPWNEFAKQVASPAIDEPDCQCREAFPLDDHSSDEKGSSYRTASSSSRSTSNCSPSRELSGKGGLSAWLRTADVTSTDESRACLEVADPVAARKENIVAEQFFLIEARLYDVTAALEDQEELAHMRYSEVLKRIHLLEESAMSVSSKQMFSASTSSDSQLIQASPGEGFIAQLERHELRLDAAEAALKYASSKLAYLQEELSALQDISLIHGKYCESAEKAVPWRAMRFENGCATAPFDPPSVVPPLHVSATLDRGQDAKSAAPSLNARCQPCSEPQVQPNGDCDSQNTSPSKYIMFNSEPTWPTLGSPSSKGIVGVKDLNVHHSKQSMPPRDHMRPKDVDKAHSSNGWSIFGWIG